MENKEVTFKGVTVNGFLMILVVLVLVAVMPLTFTYGKLLGLGIGSLFLSFLLMPGFTIL